MPFEYRTDIGIVMTAMRISATVIPMVLDGLEFWALLTLNVTILLFRRFELFEPADYNLDLPYGLTSVTGKLMTFFVCFYNGHIFARYNNIYDLTKSMTNACVEVVSGLRIEGLAKGQQRKIAKLAVASCFMFYYERTSKKKEGDKIAEGYDHIERLELLSRMECQQLRQQSASAGDGTASMLVLQWAMQHLRKVTNEPQTRDDCLCAIYARMYKMRQCQAKVQQILDLQMPFQYFHIMNLMLCLNLLLWAWSLACEDTLFAPLIYTFVQMMFQGIRELSTALSEPFGDDLVDFPVEEWLNSLYTSMYIAMEDRFEIERLEVSGEVPLCRPAQARVNITHWAKTDYLVGQGGQAAVGPDVMRRMKIGWAQQARRQRRGGLGRWLSGEAAAAIRPGRGQPRAPSQFSNVAGYHADLSRVLDERRKHWGQPSAR